MKRFEVKTASVTDKSCTVVFGNTRLSVLTPCLVRVEKGNFCDEPTQRVWIVTDKAHFMYSLRSGSMRRIILADGRRVTHFSRGNLKGTRRTLDGCDGAVPLESGLVSRGGVAVMDDSNGLILRGDKIVSRPKCSDKYYFAYGSEYRACIADFFKLCGKVPLLPRFALGNWWRRRGASQGAQDHPRTFL